LTTAFATSSLRETADSTGMQKQANPVLTSTPTGERRPFLYLSPRSPWQAPPAIDVCGLALLIERVGDDVPILVRSLVAHTMALQHRTRIDVGPAAPLPISVLNRRRRSARAWVQAILTGATDATTLHALTHTWAPQLAGTGPDLRACESTARSCIEFLRGAITALVISEPSNNLLPEAHAIHALENVLAVHLGAIEATVAREQVV
jgi:hypothetical protein